MKVLVTGGAGFIGSNFVRSLINQGHEVVNVDRLTYAGNLDNLGEVLNHPKHHFYKADICDKAEVIKIIQEHQPDSIVHMAAESHVDRSIDCADDFIQTNVVGSHAVLDAALWYYKDLSPEKQTSFRFLHLSTDEVFGALGKEGVFDETSPYKPNSPYAASKASSDLLVRAYHKTYGFPVVVVNTSNNFGPRQYPEKLIPLTILNALEEKPLPVYGEGQQVRDWIYVEDHVRALSILLKEGRVGQTYCVGADNEMKNLDLVHWICDVLDEMRPRTNEKSYRELITFVKDRPGHDFRYGICSDKIMRETSWKPHLSFKEGFKKTIEWYIEASENLSQVDARKRQGLRNIK